MPTEILFDQMTLAEVKARAEMLNTARRDAQNQNEALNLIALTVARSRGCQATDRVQFNAEMTGIILEEAPDAEPGAAEGGELKLPRMDDPPAPPAKRTKE